jgi:hypothetical protein
MSATMAAFARRGKRDEHGKCQFAGEKLEAAIGVEPMMEVLQTSALPHGYAASA